MELTDWIPCTTPPIREGLYEIERRTKWGRPFERHAIEKIPYKNGRWIHEECDSKIMIWISDDYWRGIYNNYLMY